MSAKDDPVILRNIELIAARKSDYLHAVMELLDTRTENLTVYERRGLKDALTRAIAALDLNLFLTVEEVRRKELDPAVKLDDLDRQAIWKSLQREIAERFPGIVDRDL